MSTENHLTPQKCCDILLNVQPHPPEKITMSDCYNILSQVLEQCIYLLSTCYPLNKCKSLVEECIAKRDRSYHPSPVKEELIGEQMDALADAMYYIYNVVASYHLTRDVDELIRHSFNSTNFDSDGTIISEFSFSPRHLLEERIVWLVKMILSEMDELLATLDMTHDARDQLFQKIIDELSEKCLFTFEIYTVERMATKKYETICKVISSLLGLFYIWGSKKGYDLSAFLRYIHTFNMAKINPMNGPVVFDNEGKVQKPASGWVKPNVQEEYLRQVEEIKKIQQINK